LADHGAWLAWWVERFVAGHTLLHGECVFVVTLEHAAVVVAVWDMIAAVVLDVGVGIVQLAAIAENY